MDWGQLCRPFPTRGDDFDGRMIAAALEDAPPRVSKPKRLDLTQIDFVHVIRSRFLAAGDKAGVCVLLSKADGLELRSP